VLADLLAAGTEREHAYRAVQAAADRTHTHAEDFGAALAKEGIDIGPLRPERFLANHNVIRDRLESLRELED
jgi:adenylosuccinate lyase